MSVHSLYGPIQAAISERPLLLVWPRVGAAAEVVAQLNGLGATVLGVAGVVRGRSDLPVGLPTLALTLNDAEAGDEADAAGPDFIREFQRYERRMSAGSDALQAFFDALDPQRQARVLAPSAAELAAVCGRPVWGAVDPVARRALEDKTTIDALWDALGCPRAPCAVVPLAEAARAAADLDRGEGTVWAGDNTTTIEGGAITTRHVFDRVSKEAAITLFSQRCASVRVMPYISGVPCAVQALCTPSGVVALRPMEMLVLREPAEGRFVLCGMSTQWDPSWEARAAMRSLAHRVGAHLHAQWGWRGGFSIDGILDPAGTFWPTELNARFSAGLSLLENVLPGPPLQFIDRALRAGADLPIDAAALERALLPAVDHRRVISARLHHLPMPPAGGATLRLAPDEAGVWVEAPTATRSPATLRWTDTGTHGVLTLDPEPILIRRGPPLGPRFAEALAAAEARWGLGLPPLRSPAAEALKG
jgi:hypothetical protein